MSDPYVMLGLVKNGDLSTNNLRQASAQLIKAIGTLNVALLDAGNARTGIEIANELEQLVSSFRSKCAAQLSKCVDASQPSSEGAGARAVRDIFADTSMSRREGQLEAAKAEAVVRLPELAENLDDVSSSNLASIARHTSKLGDDDAANLDHLLITDKAKSLPADHFERFIKQHVVEKTSDLLTDHKAKRAASKVSHWLDSTSGMGHIHAELDPERYESIANRIDREVTRLANERNSSATTNARKDKFLAADAFCHLLGERTGARESDKRSNSTTDLLVLVDYQTLKSGRHEETIAETESGTPLADETLSRLACDSAIRSVELDEKGIAINVGRKQRVATDAQWAAIKAMYRSCAWHGCSTRIQHCQLHHIRYWRNGGGTDMDNLVPLCSHHHHQVHEGGWSLKLEPDRSLILLKPDKTEWKRTKPPNRLDSG